MKNFLLSFGIAMLGSSFIFNAAADTGGELCTSIANDNDRLKCYDAAFKPPKAKTNSSKIGKWNISETINPLDDTKRVILDVESSTGRSRWGKVPTLILRCQSNKTEMYILWDDYLGRDSQPVTIRVDSQGAVTLDWALSTDSKATFAPQPITLLKELLNSSKFIAQTIPYNSNPVTAVFDISGLDEAIKPLRETCNW